MTETAQWALAAGLWFAGAAVGMGVGVHLGGRTWRAMTALRARMSAADEIARKMQDTPGSFARRTEERAIEIAGRKVLRLPDPERPTGPWDLD